MATRKCKHCGVQHRNHTKDGDRIADSCMKCTFIEQQLNGLCDAFNAHEFIGDSRPTRRVEITGLKITKV